MHPVFARIGIGSGRFRVFHYRFIEFALFFQSLPLVEGAEPPRAAGEEGD
jgi:hypothetical protein